MKRPTAVYVGIIAVFMLILTAGSSALADDTGFDPYYPVHFADLKENEQLTPQGMDGVSVAVDESADGVVLRGTAGQITAGRLIIDQDYNFTKLVGRISISGKSEPGVLVKACIYLDAVQDPGSGQSIDPAAEPLVKIPLETKGKKDAWKGAVDATRLVLDKNITGSCRVSVGFEIAGKEEDQQMRLLLNRIEFAEDSGIPTVDVHVDETDVTVAEMNASPDHSVKCTGSLDVIVPSGFTGDYLDKQAPSLKDLKLKYIRGRGNSTWEADKKPYKIKFDEKQDLFGMGESKEYGLIANRFDNSLMRNRMTYWLGAKLGMPYTPQCVPVDLVMNGEYYGSYLLCELVGIGEFRVNIDHSKEKDRGYLLAMSPYMDEETSKVFATQRGATFINEEPDFIEEGDEQQKKYIRDYMDLTENAIFGEDFKDEDGHSYTEYLDRTSAAKYWWIQELSVNGDAYRTDSTYLYKDKSDKLYWGPLWDFDYVCWGNQQCPFPLATEGFAHTRMDWMERMMADPEFVTELEAVWAELGDHDGSEGLLTQITKQGGLLDQYGDELSISQRYDHLKNGYYADHELPDDYSYRDEIDQLRGWITDRQSWVDEHIGELEDQTCTLSYYADDKLYMTETARKGCCVTHKLAAPEKEGYLFDKWTDKEGVELDMDYMIEGDTDVYAQYIEIDTATKTEEVYFPVRKTYVEAGESIDPDVFLYPDDAQLKMVRWMSTDPAVAEVDDTGCVTALKPGETTIRATLYNGTFDEYEMTVYDPEQVQPAPITDISVRDETVKIREGEHAVNPVTILPDEGVRARESLTFTSKDDEIAIVHYGVVFGVAPGTTTVTVTEDNSGSETSYKVTVLPEKEPATEDDIDQAVLTIRQIDRMVDQGLYTQQSYAAYAAARDKAMKALAGGDTDKETVRELRHAVVKAYMSLDKKKANTIRVRAKKAVVRRSKLRRKARSVKRAKLMKVTGAKGKVTYKMKRVTGKKYKKYFKVAAKTGKVTVKKGLKKGLYKLKIRVSAAGDGEHLPASRTVTCRVRVR